MGGPLPAPVRRTLGRGVSLALVATVAIASVARSAEVVATEVEGTTNHVTVEQGQTVTFTLAVRATGLIRCTATESNPATATFSAAYSIDPGGEVTAAAPPTAVATFHAGPPSGTSCQITWPGDPASQQLPMTLHADIDAPLGDHVIMLRPDLFTPPGSGDTLQDRTRTMLTFTVVPGSDTTSPVVECGDPQGTAGDGGWFLTAVSHECSASDDGSGLADAADTSFWLTTSGQGTVWTDLHTIADQAGNTTTAGPLGPYKVDLADPEIHVSSPADGATFLLGEQVEPSFVCSDSASGVATCAGGAVDTTTVGDKTFVATATDHAGRGTTLTHTYRVVYGFTWGPPAGSANPKAGSAVVKSWTIDGAGKEAFVGTSSVLCGGGVATTAVAPGRSTLTHYEGAGAFRSVWKSHEDWSGTCRTLQIHLDDGSTRSWDVVFR